MKILDNDDVDNYNDNDDNDDDAATATADDDDDKEPLRRSSRFKKEINYRRITKDYKSIHGL